MYVASIVSSLLREGATERKDMVENFISTHPLLYANREPSFYSGKCSIITCLFIEHTLRQNENIRSMTFLRGFKNEWDKKYGAENAPCHVVAMIDGWVFDMTFAQVHQLSNPERLRYWEVRRYSEWIKDYDREERREFDLEECEKYKREFRGKVNSFVKRNPKFAEYAMRHLNDLTSMGYLR